MATGKRNCPEPEEQEIITSNEKKKHKSSDPESSERGSKLIRLNVGGTPVTISRALLEAAPVTSLLKMMFDGRLEPTHLLDENGRYFIEENKSIFDNMLFVLRHGEIPTIPSDGISEQMLQKALGYWIPETQEVDQEPEASVVGCSEPGKSRLIMQTHRPKEWIDTLFLMHNPQLILKQFELGPVNITHVIAFVAIVHNRLIRWIESMKGWTYDLTNYNYIRASRMCKEVVMTLQEATSIHSEKKRTGTEWFPVGTLHPLYEMSHRNLFDFARKLVISIVYDNLYPLVKRKLVFAVAVGLSDPFDRIRIRCKVTIQPSNAKIQTTLQ